MEYDQAQEKLRMQLLAEASESVKELESRDDIRAAILTGSAAWGKPNPDGDIDILLITREGAGVCYRYLIPGFSPVKRRTEHGFIPRRIALGHLEEAFASNLSASMIEQLKHGRVLFQRDGEGDELIARSREVRPGTFLIGSLIGDCSSALGALARSIAEERLEDAVLAARRLGRTAARLLLMARERTGVSKQKHEYRAVRRHFDEEEGTSFRAVTGISLIDDEQARDAIEMGIELLRWVLRGRSISTELVDYD